MPVADPIVGKGDADPDPDPREQPEASEAEDGAAVFSVPDWERRLEAPSGPS